MLLFKQISENNRSKYGTEAEKVLKIIINQYSDRTHFIYEILQNAEDAGAKYLQFQLEKDRLLIFHNGRPFNEKDVDGVCGIANGTKEDGTRIGHFGIGFKSVYCYTEQPYIYSGQYHFKIKNQLFPEEVPEKPGLDYAETCMILPFDKPEVPVDVAYQEIKDALVRKITAESILMLNSIEDIKIQITGYPEVIEISKKKYQMDPKVYPDNVFSLSMRTTVKNYATKKQRISDANYLFFTDAEQEATAIIFKVDGKELKAVKNSKIYAFFPTAKEAHQNFYIHAPFDTTPARDNFKEGAEYGKHNIVLVKAIGELIWFAFQWMRDHHYLSVSGFNTVFPIYEYEEDDVLYGIYKNSIDIIREEAILPTNNPGEFKSIDEICVPLWSVIVDIFNDEDLRILRRNRKLSWLAKEFATESYREIRTFLNQNFTLETLEWKDLVTKMDAFFLSQKSLDWMEKLMSRIESYCVKKITSDGHFIDVSKIPFVRTINREQICARDEDGKLLVYLNNPKHAAYQIESTFLKNDAVRSFYQRALLIPEYNIEQEAVESILPKYSQKPISFRTANHLQENIDDLKIIKDAIARNPLILEKVQEAYVVTDGNDWYRPSELYIRNSDLRSGYSLVKGLLSIRYLSDKYFEVSTNNLKIDEEFFRKIGCNGSIRMVEATKDDYLKAVRKYIGPQEEKDLRFTIFNKYYISKKLNWAFNFEGFPQVFEGMSKERSLSIARFLNANAVNFDIQGELVGADDQHFSGKNVDSMLAYSMLGLQLCFEKWIYIQGNPNPFSPAEIDKADILPEYKAAKHLIGMLPFKEVKNPLTDWLDANIDDKGELDLIKHYLASPEALAKVAKAMAKSEAQAEARKGKIKSAKDLIEKGDKAQKETDSSSDGFEVTPISEKAKQKREENLEKELAASLDNFTSLAKGIHFTSRHSDKEERLFLEQEYEGYCQICLTRIKKYDDKPYFEAINIVKFSKMSERIVNSSKLAWNSLCLCPNCAAKYNYCSKKISTLYEQIMNTEVEAGSEDPIQLSIELPAGTKQVINYTPRHFLALKEALKMYSNEE